MTHKRKELVRGMREIRTFANLAADVKNVPHKVFMKISALEMEKFRREQERGKAMERVQAIDERIQEIDLEVNTLLQSIGVAAAEKISRVAGTQDPKSIETSKPQSETTTTSARQRPSTTHKKFVFKY